MKTKRAGKAEIAENGGILKPRGGIHKATKQAFAAGFLILLLLVLFHKSQAEEKIVLYQHIEVDQNATILDLGDLRIVDVEKLRSYLDRLARLESVVMMNTRLEARQFEELSSAYPQIEFDCLISFAGKTASTRQSAFSTLHRERGQRYPSSAFLPLRFLRELRALDLGHNRIEDLSFLEAFTGLKVLILADNRIRDLEPLSALKDLEYLELFFNDFSDLTPLSGLQNLRDLNLCRNRIEDITPLLGLTALERLWLPDNFLSAQQKKALEAALPDCQIVYEWSKSTAFGWREHPRYFVIRDMFKTGIYRPFDP